jgi:transposase
LAILDAGYYSDDNFRELYDEDIAFVTRMKENTKLYKNLVATHMPNIELKDNIVDYNGRYVYLKLVECQLIKGYPAYAYVGLDIERKASETKKLFAKAKAQSLSNGEVFDRMSRQGGFVLVSSRRLGTAEILPVYYTRQRIEQVFDIRENYAKAIPLRVQNENTFRGHLLLTFIATAIIKKLQDKLKNSSYNPISLFLNMRNQKCKVYDKMITTQEAFKKANDCYKLLGIKCPIEIPR